MEKDAKSYEFGRFRLIPAERLLLCDGEPLPLTPKAFEVLTLLVEQPGHLVEKDELMRRVWGDSFVEESAVARAIWNIRHALDEKAHENNFIETVPKRGYRFTRPVRRVESNPHEAGPDHEYNSNASETAAPTRSGFVTSRPVNRRGLLLAAVFVVPVIVAALGFGIYRNARGSLGAAPVRNIQSIRLTTIGKVTSASISPDARFIVYIHSEDTRESIRLRNIATASDVLVHSIADARIKSVEFSASGDHIYYLAKNELFKVPVLGGHPAKLVANVSTGFYGSGFSLSPDGKQVVFARFLSGLDSQIVIANVNGSNERMLISNSAIDALAVGAPEWSPDGATVAFIAIDKDGIHRGMAANVENGYVTPLAMPPSAVVGVIKWLPDSKALIVIASSDDSFFAQLWKLPFPTGEPVKIIDDPTDYAGASVSADGRYILALKGELGAHLYLVPNGDAGRARQITSGFEKYDGLGSLLWTSNSTIAYSSRPSGEFKLVIADLDTGLSRDVTEGCGSGLTGFAAGEFLVGICRIEGAWRLVRIDAVTGLRIPLSQEISAYPAISPDGRFVTFLQLANGTLLWQTRIDGTEPKLVAKLPAFAVKPAFSPDGTVIAVYVRDKPDDRSGYITLVSKQDGHIISRILAFIQANEGEGQETLQWTPDGKAISYVRLVNGVSNIWRQPIDGGGPFQVTEFDSGRIFNFAYSQDGTRLVVSRGVVDSDVVLFEHSH